MIKLKDLLTITGYIHGGCSPIGMKKNFQVFIDESSNNFQTINFYLRLRSWKTASSNLIITKYGEPYWC